MSISELNHFMTYVLDGWILFSAGFVSIGFISFVSKRIQEDLEAEALALAQAEQNAIAAADTISTAEVVESAVMQTPATPKTDNPKPAAPAESDDEANDDEASEPSDLEAEEDEAEAARLKKVAAVSEELAKTKSKQSDTSSVSVST